MFSNNLSKNSNKNKRYQIIKSGMKVAIIVNLFLGIIKIFIGIIGNSGALLSDGVHSLADLFADFFTLIAAKVGSKPPDLDHPYGHKRIETFFNFWLGIILIITASVIGWESVINLTDNNLVAPDLLTLWIALLSVVLNEGLFRYLKLLNKRFSIPILLTNAYHARADVYSSVIVFVGILAALFGYAWLEVVAMFIVACFIAKMGCKSVWSCVQELTDSAVPPKMLKQIEQVLADAPQVKQFYNLRTRTMAESILLDLHILVPDYISVSEGHYIAEQTRYNLMQVISRLDDVIIHIDYCQHKDQHTFLFDAKQELLQREFLIKLVIKILKINILDNQLIINYWHKDNNKDQIGFDLIILLSDDQLMESSVNILDKLGDDIKVYCQKKSVPIGNVKIYVS